MHSSQGCRGCCVVSISVGMLEETGRLQLELPLLVGVGVVHRVGQLRLQVAQGRQGVLEGDLAEAVLPHQLPAAPQQLLLGRTAQLQRPKVVQPDLWRVGSARVAPKEVVHLFDVVVHELVGKPRAGLLHALLGRRLLAIIAVVNARPLVLVDVVDPEGVLHVVFPFLLVLVGARQDVDLVQLRVNGRPLCETGRRNFNFLAVAQDVHLVCINVVCEEVSQVLFGTLASKDVQQA